ncbi:hypothetical protein CCR75_007082 [Bremia lactucae]|uniref:Uncharacterized protein n=1 Tax=Bremia lactucae TaxID=4779 RepID=A0A976FFZ7_BRELC|nr:hypothetical protein CCR75_007082 [Bremia lactucae]
MCLDNILCIPLRGVQFSISHGLKIFISGSQFDSIVSKHAMGDKNANGQKRPQRVYHVISELL